MLFWRAESYLRVVAPSATPSSAVAASSLSQTDPMLGVAGAVELPLASPKTHSLPLAGWNWFSLAALCPTHLLRLGDLRCLKVRPPDLLDRRRGPPLVPRSMVGSRLCLGVRSTPQS